MIQWDHRNAWIGVFDILGFKNRIRNVKNDFGRFSLTSRVDELVKSLDSERASHGGLEYLIYADTFVVTSTGDEMRDYPWFLSACKKLIRDSIRVRLPMRGAISVGPVSTSITPPILLGEAFLEAHEYCDAQDWIGLLLTPSATKALREGGLEPLRHDFVEDPEIPVKDLPLDNVVAYRFQNGKANFECYLLNSLREMSHFSPEQHKKKYDNTIAFITRHEQYLEDVPRMRLAYRQISG